MANLERWVSPRTIKETLRPTDRAPLPAHVARRRVNPLRSTILAASRSTRVRTTVTSVRATRRVVDRFVAGATASDALECVHRLTGEGLRATVDHLGEEVADAAGADATVEAYARPPRRARVEGPRTGRGRLGQADRPRPRAWTARGALDRARAVLAAARAVGATMTVDMEHSALTDHHARGGPRAPRRGPERRRGAPGDAAPHRGRRARSSPQRARGSGSARAPTPRTRTSRSSAATRSTRRTGGASRSSWEPPARRSSPPTTPRW